MRFLHTADLHLGKTVSGYSMLECQRDILHKITLLAKEKRADALVLSGDIYDRPLPGVEAVVLLDSFLTELSGLGIKVLAISGNHDSPERIGYAGSLLGKEGVYVSGVVRGQPRQVVLKDAFGRVVFTLLPFVKPAVMGCATQQETLELLLSGLEIDTGERNVLIAHQFVTDRGRSPVLSDSENTAAVGGLEQVEASAFRDFDYTALGHIHGLQRIGEGQVWYAGSPLKYSMSETRHEKGVNLVELGEKGDISVERLLLKPLHDMRRIRGSLSELTSEETAGLADREDFIEAVLTDGEELLNPMESLKRVYPNVMHIVLEKRRGNGGGMRGQVSGRRRTVMELFEEFYLLLEGKPLDMDRRERIRQVIEEAGEGKENEA